MASDLERAQQQQQVQAQFRSELSRQIAAEVISQLGGAGGNLIAPHMAEIRKLNPAFANIDAFPFEASITTAGVITQPGELRVPGDYDAELVGIVGFMSNPGTDPELLPLVTWNVRPADQKANMFTADQRMAYYANIQGNQLPMRWERGARVFERGTALKVTYSILTGYTTAASETKTFGILLLCNLSGGGC